MDEVSLQEMLEAREARAKAQRRLLEEYPGTLLCFTMNIAGPIKTGPLILRAFAQGLRALDRALCGAVRHRAIVREKTGCEAFYALSMDARTAKAIAVQIEDASPMARLFDLDVLGADGVKLERQALGLPARRCLLCDAPAARCARSRQHSVEALQRETFARLRAGLDEADAARIADCACRALLYEVATTPKPGLVDRAGSGSHRDMDFYTFLDSALALRPYFARCVRIARAGGTPEEIFCRLRPAGLRAEGEMRAATHGVNTHKGAIFTLGLLCAAAARLETDAPAPQAILDEAARMTQGLVARDLAGLAPEAARSAGARLYLSEGVTGVRGQAEAGFPAISRVGLPRLTQGLARGLSIDEAGAAALLWMLAQVEDTNMMTRSSPARARAVAAELRARLEKEPFPGRETLQALDSAFVAENLSPGGSADLLAGCYFLHFLSSGTIQKNTPDKRGL